MMMAEYQEEFYIPPIYYGDPDYDRTIRNKEDIVESFSNYLVSQSRVRNIDLPRRRDSRFMFIVSFFSEDDIRDDAKKFVEDHLPEDLKCAYVCDKGYRGGYFHSAVFYTPSNELKWHDFWRERDQFEKRITEAA